MIASMKKRRVVLVNLFPPSLSIQQAKEDASEMYYLVESLGDSQVVDMVNQRGYPAKSAYIGTGKAQEVATFIVEQEIDIVILNGIAKPRQLYALWQSLSKFKRDILVWDRVDLILQIFLKHAHTAEAKLQIELANMRHMGPRIYGMGKVLSQQAGGIGTRGIGETNVELMKRHWRDAMLEVKKKLLKLERQREMQIQQRRQTGLLTVSIVGYTNAGKTTLFNTLTRKDTFADNVLFATLDARIGKVYLPTLGSELFISDTIGFIKNLPPSLIDAFTSTLLESIYADIIIHVLDGSSSAVMDQLHTVEDILYKLKLQNKSELFVVNKSDQMTKSMKEEIKSRLPYSNLVFISAKTGDGINILLESIEQLVQQQSLQGKQIIRKELQNNIPTRDDLFVGQSVAVIKKQDQKEEIQTEGTISRILTHGYSHPHGIKVELADGTQGRVKKILYADNS